MRPIRLEEIKDLVQYERIRKDFQRHVIALRNQRRVSIGDRISLAFENRETVLYQIQEMVRAERMVDPAEIQHEVETYNTLIPGPNELSATLFIEVEDRSQVQAVLDSLIGVDEHVSLVIGERPPIRAIFEPGRSREDRIAAVQYIRFPLTTEDRAALIQGDLPIIVRIDHPNYRAEAALSEETRRALVEDLTTP